MEEKKKFCKEFENKYKVTIKINEKAMTLNLIFVNYVNEYRKIVSQFTQEYTNKFNVSLREIKTSNKSDKTILTTTVVLVEDDGEGMPVKVKEPKPQNKLGELVAFKEAPKTPKSFKKVNDKNNKK